jgi:type VI secretion system protein ImpF
VAELAPRERLHPSLLDRLLDDEPDRRQESADRRVFSMAQLRQAVLRDLAALLNTPALDQSDPLDDHPRVARSVVNYGVRDLSGVIHSGIDLAAHERRIREAIWNFEPRILRDSVRVRAVSSQKMGRNALSFEIEGELWAHPAPLHVVLKSEIDLDTGDTRVTEQGDRPA